MIQVATLCGNFDESRTRVGAVSSNLRVQWQTSMALQGSISILKDVQSAVATHAELEGVMKLGKWTACVPLLLRLANKCASGPKFGFDVLLPMHSFPG
jgi:hypothetical protein